MERERKARANIDPIRRRRSWCEGVTAGAIEFVKDCWTVEANAEVLVGMTAVAVDTYTRLIRTIRLCVTEFLLQGQTCPAKMPVKSTE